MSEMQALTALLSRFLLGVDSQDARLVAETLSDDAETVMELGGEVIGRSRGRAEILELLEGFWKQQTDQRRHVFTNAFLEHEDEDSATLVSYMTLLATREGELRAVATGRYRDEFVKTAGAWKIRRRHLVLDGSYE